MRLFGLEIRTDRGEPRSSVENPAVSVEDPAGWGAILAAWKSAAGPVVTVDAALSVPAFWCGVNFLSGMLASLPVHEFKRNGDGRERVTTGMLAGMLGGTVNDDYLTSFKWRKGLILAALTTGAGRAYVEKNKAGQVVNIWPMPGATKHRKDGRTVYRFKEGSKPAVTYQASEVIDIVWMPKADGVSHYNPIERLKGVLGLAIALEDYASKFFLNGGVPVLALHTPVGSPAAAARAKTDINASIRQANADRNQVLLLPTGSELKAIGIEPDKGQLIEGRRFVIEEIARVLNLPPVFLQDLTHGTFTNTEQQDLHLTKHTAATWVQDLDQEFNAKFYGPRQTSKFVEHNLDGLLRGDFKTRMEGWVRGVQGGVIMPDEARQAENRPPAPGGNRLYIQGATVPLEDAGKQPAKTPAANDAEPVEP